MGMVHQCETALCYRRLWHLSQIYSVVPILELATSMQMTEDQVRKLLLQVSMEKSWTIDVQADDMIIFVNTYVHDENDYEKNVQELIELNTTVQKLDVALATSPFYHALARRVNEARL